MRSGSLCDEQHQRRAGWQIVSVPACRQVYCGTLTTPGGLVGVRLGGYGMESVRGALRRCAVIISLRAAPCRDESRDRASANRSPESFINGLVFTLKGLTLAR